MQIYANKNQYFLQFSEKITATQAYYEIKYVMQTDYDIIVESYFHNYFGLNWTKMNQHRNIIKKERKEPGTLYLWQ